MTKPAKPILTATEIDIADAAAIKALNFGTATADQQKRAMDFLLKRLCAVGGLSISEDTHRTYFNEGKRSIGVNLLYILTEPIAKFEKKPTPKRSKT